MSVNLSVIPNKAKRMAPPILKRWLLMLFFAIILSFALVILFWPSDYAYYSILFWHCIFTFPGSVWSILFGGRVLIWLLSEWRADGWDDERRIDLQRENKRGQRHITFCSSVVHLPHVVATNTLAEQLLMPGAIKLPSQFDKLARKTIFQSRFTDSHLARSSRVERRIFLLLTDFGFKSSLNKIEPGSTIYVFLYINNADSISAVTLENINKYIKENVRDDIIFTVSGSYGLVDLDDWLDNINKPATILVISINILALDQYGTSDAAIALLLQYNKALTEKRPGSVCIHRPQNSNGENNEVFNKCFEYSLLWGGVKSQDVEAIWLSGTGLDNKSLTIFSQVKTLFKKSGRPTLPCDIDLSLGQTGVCSPWIAIAVASENASRTEKPQIIMTIPTGTDHAEPWFMVIKP